MDDRNFRENKVREDDLFFRIQVYVFRKNVKMVIVLIRLCLLQKIIYKLLTTRK